MSEHLTLGSLFDGSGGFPLGGLISGIEPLWASEIEPFPIRVTTKRLPFMKHYGDVSKLDGAELPPVDIITFGSPCQDMSVAGRRAGLDGSRSNLFYEAVRIVREMREATNGEKPRYIVWENVPGAFSSNGGEDFKAVLDTIRRVKDPKADTPRPAKWPNAGCILADDHSVAWRVFDAQYWGVPQRRKRIYLVADFAGGCAEKILFESEGLSGYTPQGFRSWQGSAGTAEEGSHPAGVGTDGYNGAIDTVAATLGVNCGMSTGRNGVMVLENHPADSRVTLSDDGKVQTLTSRMETGGNNVPLVMKIRCGCEGGGKGPLIQTDKSATLATNNDQTLFVPAVFGICSRDSNAMKSDNPNSGFYKADTTRTIDANGGNPSCNQGGMAVVALEGNGARPSHQGCGYSEEDVSFTLNATEQHGVAYGLDRATYNQGQNAKFAPCIESEVEPPMVARGPGAVAHPVYSTSKNSYHTQAEEDIVNTLVATDYKDPPTVTEEPYYIVRRLTPTECARLQGFPDWWCSALGTDEPSEEDIAFWRDVFETHRTVTGSASKPKTDAQIVKWLKDPHADSSEYKLWGNGVALPCVCFVLAGIVYYNQLQS
ncbi:MAG: DNA cytosine methyltransferase [Eubacteriales bacterium]|nr:DNA cytosine methyltransferase [Clostridiales bacterium]MDY5731823.1 DNA cytosine methyltransferase [Eubacteriales bacterium]